MHPWTVKYFPKTSADIQGQNQAIGLIKNFIEKFPRQKAALLHGPPGCGKTASVHAFCKELNYEIIEVNASDARNAESIKEKILPATRQMSLFGSSKLILIDELDGVSGNSDRGGLSELSKIIEETRFPIIMTANDPYDKKFSTIRKKSLMIPFGTLRYTSVLAVLKSIAKLEGIKYDETALTALARRAGGDLRGAINDFQTLSEFSKTLSMDDVDEISGRKQTDTMIDALMRILKTTDMDVSRGALENVSEDHDEIFLWIDQNLPLEYKDPLDLAKAYNNLALADVFRGRIRRRQHWRYLVYINDLITAGISLSKKEKYPGFNKYTRTTRILKMWQYNQKNSKRRSIADKISKKTHTSARRVIQDTLPYIQTIYKNNKKKANELTNYFEFDKDEVKYLNS